MSADLYPKQILEGEKVYGKIMIRSHQWSGNMGYFVGLNRRWGWRNT